MDIIKSESKIQQEICLWYKNSFCLKHHNPRCMIFSIPNEGRGAASLQLMATGLYPGCADLLVIHRRIVAEDCYGLTILFFECKREGGIQSEKQKAFEEHCKEMGIRYNIVRALDEFKQVIENL